MSNQSNQDRQNHNNDNPGGKSNMPAVNPVTFNLFSDECISAKWRFTYEEMKKRIEEVAKRELGNVERVAIKYYTNANMTFYDRKSGKNIPEQKLVAEVWIDEKSACKPIDKAVEANKMVSHPAGEFNDNVKSFIAKYVANKDKKVYDVNKGKMTDYRNGRKFYCIMVSIERFFEVNWDIRGTAYRETYGGNISPETEITITPIWNSKNDKSRGIRYFEVEKRVAKSDYDFTNRDPFYASKHKNKKKETDIDID